MDRDRSLDIAVTGIAARFPGASDLSAWWSAVLAGTVLTTRLGRHQLLADGVPAHLVDDPDYVPARGVPGRRGPLRQRAVPGQPPRRGDDGPPAPADAGGRLVRPRRLRGRPGGGRPVAAVFASGSGSGYLRAMLAAGPLDPATLDVAIHGTEPDFIASLIAYKLGLTGPAPRRADRVLVRAGGRAPGGPVTAGRRLRPCPGRRRRDRLPAGRPPAHAGRHPVGLDLLAV